MNGAVAGVAVICMAGMCCAQIVQPVVRGNQGHGCIDWTKRVVIVTGIGIPNPGLPQSAQRTAALEAARQAASRIAYETIGSLCFTTSSSVGDVLAKNRPAAAALGALLRSYEDRCRVRDASGGSFEATVEVPLYGTGGLFAILLGSFSTPPSVPAAEPCGDRRISGLIVDGRSVGVRPAIAPRILDERGNAVYGPEYGSGEWASRLGITEYARTVEEAMARLDRIGNEPYIAKAKKAEGKNAADAVISENDAAVVLGCVGNLKALSECRVILVIE